MDDTLAIVVIFYHQDVVLISFMYLLLEYWLDRGMDVCTSTRFENLESRYLYVSTVGNCKAMVGKFLGIFSLDERWYLSNVFLA